MMLDHFYDKLNGKIGVSFGKVIYKGERTYCHLGAAYPDKPVVRTLKNRVFSSIFNWKKQRTQSSEFICTMDSRSSDETC